MARQPRFFVPGEVLHVIQRGNNRETVYARDTDYRIYVEYLAQAIRQHGLLIHAYVLMTNHVHLLATPLYRPSIPKALQSVGRRYVQYFNTVHRRSGTLWEGRYRATVVDSEQYLLTCMRYIELNPVRAGMVRHPGEYRWTSYHANTGGLPDVLISRHELYNRMALTDSERQQAYRQLFSVQVPDADVEAIREATNKNWALGGDEFKRRIEALSGRRTDRLRMGRPSRIRRTESRV